MIVAFYILTRISIMRE